MRNTLHTNMLRIIKQPGSDAALAAPRRGCRRRKVQLVSSCPDHSSKDGGSLNLPRFKRTGGPSDTHMTRA